MQHEVRGMAAGTNLEAQLRSAETVGARLRILRQRAGYNLRGLAQAAEMDPGYLSRVENNLVPPPAGRTWDAYVRALLGPLAATSDAPIAESTLGTIASGARLSAAAIVQVLRDYPSLRRLIQFAAWIGLSEEEQHEVDRLASRLSERLATTIPSKVRGQRPILRERHSSAKAHDR
jgi:hypothetical protein